MADIVLCTLNARYAHPAFGLRCLLANLGGLRARAEILELEIGRPPLDVAGAILDRRPRIVGLGVYVWNVGPLAEVAAILRRVRPEVVVVLGGPEVGWVGDAAPIEDFADHVLSGEADLAFRELCEGLLSGSRTFPKVIAAAPPALDEVALPYDLYTDEDLAHRVTYVEASRGCPFTCEFCLSALDVPVRHFPEAPFLAALQQLLDRGARHFKFVDRTFNLDAVRAATILDWFRERLQPGLSLHFEMVPDRLPEALRERLRAFPPGVIQLEIGIQTLDGDVNRRIRRRQDDRRALENLQWLREESPAHLHIDLIAGLPGETLAGFAAGFDRLLRLRPHEIQLGILKRLRGTPLAALDAAAGMIWSPCPPYEILATPALDHESLQRVRRLARTFDLVVNSGQFVETAPLLWEGAPSPFAALLAFSEWLHGVLGRGHGIALARVAELLFTWLTRERGGDPDRIGPLLWSDYQRGGRSDRPAFLGPWAGPRPPRGSRPPARGSERQERHRGPGRQPSVSNDSNPA